jgi:hypothetical protein
MKQVRAEKTPRRAAIWPAYVAAAASLIFAILAGAADVGLNNELNADRAVLAQQSQIISDLTLPGAQRHPFDRGSVVVANGRIYLTVHGLNAPPTGKVYQTWTLARGAKSVAPSVTFTPDRNGSAVVALPVDAASTAAIAISVEPEGGSKAPTTTPIAFIKITG